MDLPPVMRITLKGVDNETYVGTLFLKNWTSWLGDTFSGWVKDDPTKRHAAAVDPHARRPDPTGATYYVIAVVLVYGMSIVMLIASHINRKHAKVLEDRQINKYLQEFQVVRETSSRDSYRNLKRDITAKLKDATRGSSGSHAYRGLTKLSLLPLAAVALPTIRENRLSVAKDSKRKYSLSPRCSFSRSSISSKTSSERKHSVLSVQSDRTTGRQVGNQRSVNPGDRATMKSSGSVDEAFSSAAKHDAATGGGGGVGSGSGRPTCVDVVPGGYTTSARRLSFPYVQQPLAGVVGATTRSQPNNKRPVSKRLQRSHHVSADSPGLDARKARTANSSDAGLPPAASVNRAAKLSPKEAASRLHATDVDSSVERGGNGTRKSSVSNQSGEVLAAGAGARRNNAANLSADNLSRVFPSGGGGGGGGADAQVSNAGTFITAASIPVPSVRTSVTNHLLPPA